MEYETIKELELTNANKYLTERVEKLKFENDIFNELFIELNSRETYYSDLKEIFDFVKMPVESLSLIYQSAQAQYGENTEILSGKIAFAIKLQQLMRNAGIGYLFYKTYDRIGTFKITKAGILRGAKCE